MRPLNITRYIFSCIVLFILLNSKLFAAAPTDLILSSNTVSENLPDSSLVGVLSTIDPDGDLVFSYSLVPGIGSINNASFVIKDDTLFSHETFNFEVKSSYSIRIRTTDGVDFYEKIFTITINDVNEAPTDISLSANTVNENLPVNTVVGTLTTTDPDVGESFTYALIAGTGGTDNASFNIVGNQLRTSFIFNYETKSSYSIRIRTSDGNLTYQEVFIITVSNVNEAPTDILLSSQQVPENQPINTVVGTLSSIDPDGDLSFTYTLVSGTGSTDNSSFNILGNQLRTNAILDSDTKPTCQIRIRSTDGGALFFEKQFTITVTNINEPPVLSGIEGTPLSYTEDQPATVITSTIVASDPENGNMASAVVRISGGFNAAEDRLLLISSVFTVNIDNANGVVNISGDGTIAQYQSALRTVRYENINDKNPSLSNRTIQFVINDGTYNSTPVSRVIQITGVNDPPVVQNDTYGGVLEGGNLVVNTANGVLDNDEDLDGPVAMTATLVDDVQFGSLTLNPNGSFTYMHNGTNNLVDGFTYRAFDGQANSVLATVTITIVGANDPPELSGIETTVLTYNEDDPSRQITATIDVYDEDNLNLQSAVIRIDNNFKSSEDLLSFTTNPSLTVNYVPATGIINVSGSATLLTYQNFLRSIRYINTNNLNPSTLIRRVTFTVNDGTNNSVAVYRYVQIIPMNDPPIATDAHIIGSNFFIGQTLTADYTFTDPDGDMEGNTTFRWYLADDNLGTGRTLINTSQKDTLTPLYQHGGKWIQVVVRPYDINGLVGVYDTSEFRYINAAPVLNDFVVTGVFAIDEIVHADYTYFDFESNPQGTHTFQWYRSSTGQWTNKQAIPGAISEQYTIIPNDTNFFIGLEAIPYATTGSSPGQKQQSDWYRVSKLPAATISGEIEMCEGSTGFLNVTLTGSNSPWVFHYVIEGTTDILEVSTNNPNYQLEVTEEGTYLLVDVSDQKFDFGIVTGTGTVSYYPQPTAELTVDELSICDNDIGIYTMPVQLTGTAPWSLSYKIIGAPDSIFISNIDTPEVEIEFTVDDLGTFQLLHVWDDNCMAIGTGTTEVILRENPKASITGDATICPGDTTQITVDLSGVGPWKFFYTLDDGDELEINVDQSIPSFEYTMDVDQAGVYRLTRVTNATDEGCAYGTATIENYVQPSATIIGDITICEGASTDIPVTLEGTSPWTISYQHNIEDPVKIDLITQNPYLLNVSKGGSYSITEVTDGNNCLGSGMGIAELTVDPAPDVRILDLKTLYTVNQPWDKFSVEPEGGDFNLSDPNTVINYVDSVIFVPFLAGVANSPHRVIYSYQDPGTGCFGRDTVIVHVIESGGTISVKGEEDKKPERYCFNWDTLILEGFNEEFAEGTFSISGGSGSALINFRENNEDKAYLIPSKVQPGSRTVTYSFDLSSGPTSVKRDFNFEKITADFTWDNECFTDETVVKLMDLSTGDNLDSLKWEIWFPDHVVRGDTSELRVTFDERDTYTVEHVVISMYGCSDTARKDLILQPTYSIHDEFYYEDFSDGRSDWVENVLNGGPNSWTFGTPTGETFNDPYERAWYTDIEHDSANENSYVISPCFDFSDAKRPMIKMDIWKAFVTNLDGAKIQYRTEDNEYWHPLGNVNEGENWYNSITIQGIPGGNGTGWTGTVNNWETAKHKLDDIPTNEGWVRFRIAYGAPPNGISRDGFAFDNIWIGERTKKVLIEHFTNMGIDTTIKQVNKDFNEVINKMNNDVIDIQYHMDRPGPDTFYSLDSKPADSRDLYYSLPNIPYAIIDGGRGNKPAFLINFANEDLKAADLDLAVLEDNKFDIELTSEKEGDYANINVKVTSLENLGQKYITVHVVIIERLIKDVTSDYGENKFESVARAMLPEADGTSYNIDWGPGTKREINLDYYYEDIFDNNEVRIVAFIQDNGTHEVYQAEMIPADPALLGIEDKFEENKQFFLLYPNPANQFTSIEFSEPISEDAQIQIIDHSGRLVKLTEMNKGDQIQTLYLNGYDPGIYIIRLITDNEILEAQKLLILGNNR